MFKLDKGGQTGLQNFVIGGVLAAIVGGIGVYVLKNILDTVSMYTDSFELYFN